MSVKKGNIFDLNPDQVAKLNSLLPKGYHLVSVDQLTKRANAKKRQKTVFIPIPEVVPLEPLGRRNKNAVSYFEGEQPVKAPRSINNDSQSQRIPKPKRQYPKEPTLVNKQSIEMFLPPPSFSRPSTSLRALSPRQILQNLEQHRKFYVFEQFKNDCPSKYTYATIKFAAQEPQYTNSELNATLSSLFIDIYGFYPKTSDVYRDSAELENYMYTLISAERNKVKEPRPEKVREPREPKQITIKDQPLMSVPLARQTSQLQRKKTVPPRPQLKNITITDKRILGQNIKKLPNECLPDICRIVFETIETREEYIIDIDTLPLKKVKELQIYVSNCMSRFGDIEDGNDNIRNQNDSAEETFIIEDDFS